MYIHFLLRLKLILRVINEIFAFVRYKGQTELNFCEMLNQSVFSLPRATFERNQVSSLLQPAHIMNAYFYISQ